MIPDKAIAAAKEAMREVTPPTGVSKADWLAEHGDFALIAGAIAAAAPQMIRAAKAEAWDVAWREAALAHPRLNELSSPNPYRSSGG